MIIKAVFAALYSVLATMLVLVNASVIPTGVILVLILSIAFAIVYTVSRGATIGILPKEVMYKW